MSAKLAKDKKADVLRKLCLRQDWRCFWCGEIMNTDVNSDHYRTLEHVIPASKGRETGDLANLRAACRCCNELRGKFNNVSEGMKRIAYLLQMVQDRDNSLKSIKEQHRVTMAGRCYFCKFRFHVKEWIYRRKQATA